MVRLAVILLAGATFVAAQTVPATTDNVDQITEQLKTKLHHAYQQAGEDADKAREDAMAFQKEMREKFANDTGKAMERRRAEANVRLQHAIENIDRASIKVGTQVQEVRDRIQARLTEKRQELVDLQKKILERQEARKAEKAKEVKEPKTEGTTPDATVEKEHKFQGGKPDITKPEVTTPEVTTPVTAQ